MPSVTALSEQAALNKLAGNGSNTTKSAHEVFNTTNGGGNSKSIQQILNENKATGTKTGQSTQQVLYNILKTPLSLGGSYTTYSEQALLNMAFNATVPILTVIGK